MNNGKLRIVGCLLGLAGVLLSSGAFAQDTPAAATPAAPPEPAPAPAPEPAPAAADASASTSGSAQVGMALPGAAPQAAAVAGNSDHDSVVGRLAVGYLGRTSVTIANPGGIAAAAIPTPVIGVRYWLSDMLGIDAGIGFGLNSSSTEAGGTDTDGPSYYAFLLHGGVPLSLASAGHFSFQIVPELNVGFAGSSVTGPMDMETSGSGFHLDVGARAGAEIHFGFIDVPQLSLQGGVGLRLNFDSQSADVGGTESSASQTSLSTTVNGDPWDIFTSNISALYYF
ncbi:MAG TPA: hypothetical protein VEX18_21715 [Polyangiaceae bacterium]|nr:hypothetical protein [Polyangiaceae bacterium]